MTHDASRITHDVHLSTQHGSRNTILSVILSHGHRPSAYMRETKNACHPKGRQARPDVVPPYFRRPARAVAALRVPDNGGYRIRLLPLPGVRRSAHGWFSPGRLRVGLAAGGPASLD